VTGYALRKTQLYWTYDITVDEIRLGYLERSVSNPRLIHPIELSGAGMPEALHRTSALPFLPGTIHETVRYDERVITFGWVARFSSVHARREYDALLRRYFRSRASAGRLRAVVYDDDGNISYQRAIDCRFKSGLDQDWSSLRSPIDNTYTIQLLAPLPYFYDATGPLNTILTMGGVTPGYLRFPFQLPLKFQGRSVSDTHTFVNGGEVDTWPVFTITGPIYWPKITNNSDDNLPYIEVQYDLGTGYSIEIDCRPGYMNVVLIDGEGAETNLMRRVTVGSEFFTLAPGDNVLQLTGSGAGEADLDVSYYEYYLGL